jgi:hypothetical protein
MKLRGAASRGQPVAKPMRTLGGGADARARVDSAEEKMRLAERETAAVAIGHQKDDDPLRTLRAVEDTLKSQRF